MTRRLVWSRLASRPTDCIRASAPRVRLHVPGRRITLWCAKSALEDTASSPSLLVVFPPSRPSAVDFIYSRVSPASPAFLSLLSRTTAMFDAHSSMFHRTFGCPGAIVVLGDERVNCNESIANLTEEQTSILMNLMFHQLYETNRYTFYTNILSETIRLPSVKQVERQVTSKQYIKQK